MCIIIYDRYLNIWTTFSEIEYSVVSRIVSFHSPTYVQALNGDIANRQYQCNLTSGNDIEMGVPYNTLNNFSSCSLVNGGFSAGSLSFTYNLDTVFALSGYNGQCQVLYGILGSSPVPPLDSDSLSVGGRVFIRLGDSDCELGVTCNAISLAGNCDATLGASAVVNFSPLDFQFVDPDGADNTVLQFDIVSGNEDGYFSISSTTGQVSLVGSLDRDLGPESFEFVVRISDGIFNSTYNIGVDVLDQNDNAPMPIMPTFSATIAEEMPTLTPVLNVIFTDTDSGDNARLTYTLETTETNFVIDSATGLVSTNRVFDYEAGDLSFTFVVTATDNGDVPELGRVNVTVSIMDVNDNRPVISASLVPNATFIENEMAVRVADVTVNDEDDNFNLVFATVDISDALDAEEFITATVPGGMKSGSSEFKLYIVGDLSVAQMSTILQSAQYNNTAEEISPPLNRTIVYSVCDLFTSDSIPSSLSQDTQYALSYGNASDPSLPASDIAVLSTACQQLISASVVLPLVEVNDRPTLSVFEVEFDPIPEDITDEENMGQFVTSVFQNVIVDPDAQGFVGLAIIGHGSPAVPQYGALASLTTCEDRYDLLLDSCSGLRHFANHRILACGSVGHPVVTQYYFYFYQEQHPVIMCRSCNVETGRRRRQIQDEDGLDLTDVVEVELVLGTGLSFNLTSPFLYGTDYDISFTGIDIEHFEAFFQGNGTYTFTYVNMTTTTLPLESLNVTYTDIGDVSDTLALVLGPYSLIRFVPNEFEFGTAELIFRAWDGSDGIAPGTTGVDTTSSSSFSLATGNATIEIVPVNDPPEIELGGPGITNYTTTYTENSSPVFITARNALVLERDPSDEFLSNLIVNITNAEGGCDLVDYTGVSEDRLIYPNETLVPMIDVTMSTSGQACVSYMFNGDLTIDQWSSYILMVRFRVNNAEPSEHRRRLEFLISDQTSTSLPSFTHIDVALVSDVCPELELIATLPLTYREHSGNLTLDSSLTVRDGDRNPEIQRATVSIESSVQCAHCRLRSSISDPAINVNYSSTTQTLTFEGPASPSTFQTVLRGVQFEDEGDEPAVNLLTVRFQVIDPLQPSTSCTNATQIISIVIEHLNDNSPVIYLDWPNDQNFNTTFTEGDNRIPVTSSQPNGVMIIEPDAEVSPSYTVMIYIDDCVPAEDLLEFMGSGGSTVSQAYDSADCSLVLAGTISDLESDLELLRYRNTESENPSEGVRTINFTIVDPGVLPGVPPRSSFSYVWVVAVNDAPEVYLDGASSDIMVTFQLGDGLVSIAEAGSITDPDDIVLQSMSISLTEYDSSGAQLSSPSDGVFESIELEDDSVRVAAGLIYTEQTSTQLTLTGAVSIAGYTSVLNEIIYTNTRIPPTENRREVSVTVNDGKEDSATAVAMISFAGALDPPVVDLNGNAAGRDSTVTYTLTTPGVTLFPSGTVTDPNGDQICRLEVTMTGSQDTCPPSSITFTSGGADIELSETTSGSTTVYTVTSTLDCRNNDIFENVLQSIVFQSDGTTPGTCTLSVIVTDDSTLNSTAAVGTITVEAYNDPPYVDLDLGYVGRDYSTVYFQGGRIRHIVSIFNATTSHNITSMTVIGEADGEAASDGTIDGGVVIEEQSDAGYVVRDSDSSSLRYLQAQIVRSTNPDNDAIRFPCKPQDSSVTLDPQGCTLAGESTTITNLECDDDVFDACSAAFDLCTDLEVRIFCSNSASKAYRFMYPSATGSVDRYEALLGYLGYEYLLIEGGTINEIRLIDISVSDEESTNLEAITRVRIVSLGLVIPTDPPLSFIVYEDERPERINSVFTVPVRTLDGLVPDPGTIEYSITGGNIDDTFRIDSSTGEIYLTKMVDREERGEYRLQVSAHLIGTDDDTTAMEEVVADIVDINDEHPVVQESFTVNVTEGTENLFVVDVNATDADEGENAELMYLILGIGAQDFTINTDGVISTSKALNVSKENFYLLVVIITDMGFPSLVAHTVVHINVITPPPTNLSFVAETIDTPVSVFEDRDIGYVFHTVEAFEVGGTGDTSFIRYRVLSITPTESERPFEVNATTGEVYVNAALNSERNSTYQVQLQAFSVRSEFFRPSPDEATLEVIVSDTNEEAPFFQNAPFTFAVAENSANGVLVGTVIATDSDDMNMGITYALDPSSPADLPFTVESDGDIVVNDTINYESNTSFTFMVQARDDPAHGMESRTTTAGVTVIVVDRNDNAPEFIGTPYTATVRETASQNDIVLTFNTTDLDSSDNSVVNYSSPDIASTPFCLVNTSVQVCNAAQLTGIEAPTTFQITIVATNSPALGSDVTQTASAEANITLILINEFDPVFDDDDVIIPGLYEENCGLGSNATCIGFEVYDFNATDDDGGVSGSLEYSLITAGVPFAVNATSGKLTVTERIDRESQGSYFLQVRVMDGVDIDGTIKWALANISITILDIDDNPPVIVEPLSFMVTENMTRTMAPFGSINVADPDITGILEYFFVIPGVESNMEGCVTLSTSIYLPIAINMVTGELYFCEPVDFETDQRVYVITVRVTDTGTLGPNEPILYSTTSSITVTIVDFNDNPPVIGEDEYRFSVKENRASNTSVGTVVANDDDSGPFGDLDFSLTYNGSSVCSTELPFVVIKTSNTTADIQTCMELDFEEEESYTFDLVVCDGAPTPMCDSASVVVTVEDQNDHAPVFTPQTYTADIEETDTSMDESFVVRVIVTDGDSGPNSISNFSIVTSGTPFGLRSETTLSADVFVMQPNVVDYDAGIRSYTLSVLAINEPADDTDTAQNSTTTVVITITDVNDNTPIINPPYEFSIRENEPVNTTVGCISVSDADDGSNSDLSYAIIDSIGEVSCSLDTPFSINATSVCLTTCEVFNYEDITSYTFTVRVCDDGTSMLCSNRSISVNIIDLNDNPLVYTEDPFFADINENTPSGETVLIITSTDADSDLNSNVTYEFVNTTAPFAIRDDAVIYYTGAEPLDYDGGPRTYVMHVRGTNPPDIPGDTTWIVDVVVTVNVIDRNDHPPVFDPEEDTRVIPEHDDAFTYVLTTTDSDTDPNSEVSYAIIGSSPFAVNGSTVIITNSDAIDFDPPNSISQYVLTIQATNEPTAQDDETQTANFTLIVNVTDINDNAPQCLGPDSFIVPEDSMVGITIRRYMSTDIDSGLNGVAGLTYYVDGSGSGGGIASGSGDPVCNFDDPFRVYMDTGDIYPCWPLDFEMRMSYTFNVTICDGAFPPMCTGCPVQVLIMDTNDNIPVLNPPTEFSVQETASITPPTEVGCINGTDADSEENGEIVYSFTEAECSVVNPFQVNSTTGCITVCQMLDFETATNYTLTVVLTDNSPPYHNTTGSITILVVNENDHIPMIISVNVANVTEEVADAEVIQVTAMDIDAPPFNVITFTLLNDAGGRFAINSTTGIITTTIPLDRETAAQYSVVVQVSDGTFDSQQNMTIFLIDINDNEPVYQGNLSYSFLEEELFDLILVYSDEDAPANSVHTFSVDNPNFSIDTMGKLNNTVPLDRDTGTGGQPTIIITITVQDGGNVVQTNITIVLIDVNDNDPVAQPPFTTLIPDPTVEGTALQPISATDADAGDNARLVYTIDGTSDMFALDSVTGNVTVLTNITLNASTSEELILTVRISDSGMVMRSTTVNYIFIIFNPDPIFPQDLYVFNITENNLGGLIDTITAMDRDANSSNDIFEYMILSVTPYDSGFSITSENDTGSIYSPNTYIDFEDSMQFDLTVAVGRFNMTPSTDETIVRVRVIDSNDNPPRLSPLNITEEIPENVANGTMIATAVGIDFDRGRNGKLSYNHSGLGEEAFAFDSSGDFQVADSRLIDFESQSNFTFNYQACDDGDPQLCSEPGVITLIITNVDDIPPEFNPNQYSETIAEDFGLNRAILSVEFADEDTPLTEIQLFLSPPQTLFQIAQVSGTLMTTNIALDRETSPSHEFYIFANDTSGQMSNAFVTIYVSDINDERPHVEPLQSMVSFSEGGGPVLIASSLSVVDEDDVSIYPLTSVDISLHPSPESAESYPLAGGICDHANYSILYDENVYRMCGFSASSCLYLLEPGILLGGTLTDKILFTGGTGTLGFARYFDLFSGSDFESFSVSLWLRLGSQSASGSIFELRTTNDFEFNLRTDSSGAGMGILTLLSRTNTLLTTGQLNTHDDQWHHIAVVRDTDSFVIYFDGIEEARDNTTNLFDTSFDEVSFFFGFDLESEYIAEVYVCFSSISQEDVQCSLTCGESFDIQSATDDVNAIIDLRTRSLSLEYTGDNNTASQTQLEEALRKVLYINDAHIEEPHPLSRGVFIEVFDVIGPSDERGVITLVPDLLNDQKPVLDLNGLAEEGVNYATTFEELSSGVHIIGDDAALYDEDSGFFTMGRIVIEIVSPTTVEELFVTGSVPGLNITQESTSRVVIESSTSIEHYPGVYLDALRVVQYRDLQDEPVQADHDIQFTVYDMGQTFINSPLSYTTVTVVPTNDPPVLDLDSLSSATRDTSVVFEEEDGVVELLSGISQSITDPDSSLVSMAIITFTKRPDGDSETLGLDSDGLSSAVVENFTSSIGTLTLTGIYDFDTWLEILRRVVYENAYGNPDEDIIRQVSMQVVDDDGGISEAAYVNISVVPFNNPPDIFLGGPGSADFYTVFEEDGPCIPIANVSMEIFDVDSESIVFVRATLQSNNVDTNFESIRTTTTDITGNYISGNPFVFITLEDSSLDNYELAVPTIVYCNTEDEPDEGTREVEVAVRDTGSGSLSAFAFAFIEIKRINDQPSLELQPLNNISIRGVATPIIDPTSIVLEDSDDNRFLALYIFITNNQDGVASETIIFDTTLPANTTARGSLLTSDGEILSNVTFRGGGADANQVINTISNIRYRNTATDITVDPPRTICLQVADQSLYFSERVCVNVIISPPNFFPPVITSNFSPMTYGETDSSITIGTVTATDDDVDLAGQIMFSISQVLSTTDGGTQVVTTSSGIFEIDSSSGVLTASQGLDAEAYTRHVVTVTASDLGNPIESNEIEIDITVTDLNDNVPVFVGGPYVLPDVREAQTAPGNIDEDEVVRAEDGDLSSANNRVVMYFLDTVDSRFSIDATTGVIQYVEELDADEGDRNIVLTVGAVDSGTPSQTGYTTVSFLIEEINDYEARVEQVSTALFVIEDPARPQSIGPAIRIDDRDLSNSSITSVSVKLTVNEDDKQRDYVTCLAVCQPSRIDDAGLSTSFSLFDLPDRETIFRTDQVNPDGFQFLELGDGSCDTVRLTRGATRATDGYGRIERSEVPSDFLSGDFSISFVAKVTNEGFVVIVPDQTTENLQPADVERDFAIWLRRRDFRIYYVYGTSRTRGTNVYQLPSGEEFFDPTLSIENAETKHYTIVVSSSSLKVYLYIGCTLAYNGDLEGQVVIPNPDSDVFIGGSRPSPVTGGRLGAELHGLYYHPKVLSSSEILDFCSCGFETLNLPSPLPASISATKETDSNLDVTLSFSPAQSTTLIPEADIVSVLRDILYENTFNPPTVDPARPLEFTVEEDNNQPTEITSGSIQLVTSDNALPEIDLSGPVTGGIDYTVEFTEDGGAVSVSSDVRVTRIVPAPAVATFNQIEIVLKDGVDADEYLVASSSRSYITVQGSGTASVVISGPGDSTDFASALSTVMYLNTNDRPTTNFDRTIEFTVTDTKGDVNDPLAMTTVRVTAVNDPPELSLSENGADTMQTVEYNERAPTGVNLAPEISVVDVDNDNLQSAVVALTTPSLFADSLQIEVIPSSLTWSYSSTTGLLTVTGPAPFSAFEQALQNITFESTDSPFLDNNGDPIDSVDRSVTFTVSDGQVDSDPVTVNIAFQPVDDPPHILSAPSELTYTEGDESIRIAPMVVLIDDDNDQLMSLQVVLQTPLDGDILFYENTSSALLRFDGASLSEFQSILRQVSFVNTANEPILDDRQLNIEVCDYTACDSVSVTITIESANDNTPMFDSAAYNFEVAEDTAVGTIIDTISVSDVDDRDTVTTTFQYRIWPSSVPIRLERIGDGDEIQIIIDALLDAENTTLYEFVIFASDGTNEGSTNITLTVTNVNEAPSISFDSSTATIVGSPNSETQLLQISFSISDPDVGDTVERARFTIRDIPTDSNEMLTFTPELNGFVFAEIVGGEPDQFELELTDSSATNNSLQDALLNIFYAAGSEVTETTVIRSVDITVFDAGGLESESVTVTVSLASIPVFSMSTYSLSLSEGIVHTDFLQVVAMVESGGDVLNYDIEQGVGVSINEMTGYLSLTELLDREEMMSLSFEVFAIDNLPPARRGSAVVSITILDANDVKPNVTIGQPNITIFTGVSVTLLPNISVSDPDISSDIIRATVTAVGQTDLVASPFTGEVCVDENIIFDKMEQVCGLTNYTNILANVDSLSGVTLEDDSFGNRILTNTDSSYVSIATAGLSSLLGTISEVTVAFWIRPEESGYLVYIGRQDPVERYYAIFYDKDANQFIVTLKSAGLSGLQAQVRVTFQVQTALNDGDWHFVMIEYGNRDLLCVVDGVIIESLAVVYKDQPFIGEVTGE